MPLTGEQIERESRTPLYRQVASILRERIERGLFKPGERIPTEYELCDHFGVSRTSVRQALSDLVHEGLLLRRQGSGTYVQPALGPEVQTINALVTEDPWVIPLEAAAASFNADHPTAPVHMNIERLGRPQLRRNILAAVGRGEAPDLALIDWPWVAEFADLHFLHSLDDLDPEWIGAFRQDLFAAFIDQGRPPLYAIQPEANVSVIWYRRDWLKEAGIAPPSSWDELVDAAKQFVGGGRHGMAFVAGTTAGETTTYQLLPFLWAAGASLLSHGSVALDDRAVGALQFLVDLVSKHRVAPAEVAFYSWDQPARLFAAGKAAFAVGGSYERPRIRQLAGWDEEAFDRHVGHMPIPAPAGGSPAAAAGGMAFVVFRQSRNARLSFEIIKRVGSPEIMRDLCAHSGRCPTRMSVVRSLDPQRDRFSREIADLLHNARARHGIAEYSKVSEQFQLMVEDSITQRLTPQEAVERAREIIRILVS
jgi:multiple sugar transport system substrate-binding protein